MGHPKVAYDLHTWQKKKKNNFNLVGFERNGGLGIAFLYPFFFLVSKTFQSHFKILKIASLYIKFKIIIVELSFK